MTQNQVPTPDTIGEVNTNVALVSVDYDEFKPWTLRGFRVDWRGGVSTFDTLDRALDYANRRSANVMILSYVDNYKADVKNCVRH